MLCWVCTAHTKPRKRVLRIDHAGYTTHHELDHKDHTDHTDQEWSIYLPGNICIM